MEEKKSKIGAGLLGIFLGGFGVHNFYLGYKDKAIAQLFLLKNPELNIFAVLYSDILCYLVAVFLNLVYIICIYKKRKLNDGTNTCGSGSERRRPLFESLRRDKEIR